MDVVWHEHKGVQQKPMFLAEEVENRKIGSEVLRAIKYLFLVVSSGQNVIESIVNVGTRLSRQKEPPSTIV